MSHLDLNVLLRLHPKIWYYSCVPRSPVQSVLGKETQAPCVVGKAFYKLHHTSSFYVFLKHTLYSG